MVTMVDQHTIAQLLQAPTEGFEDAIIVPAITTDNFELKHDQDSLNSVAGGNFLDKMPRKCLAIIKSKSKVRYSRNKLVVAKLSMNTSTSVEESCVTFRGAHSYRNCPSTDGKVYHDNIQEFVSQASAVNYNQENTSYRPPMMSNQICPPGFPPVPNNQNVQLNQRNNQNRFIKNQNRGYNFNQRPVYQPLVFQPPAYQAPAYQAPAPQTQCVSKEDFSAYVKANDAVMRNMQTQGQNMQNQLTNRTDLITKFVNSNSASTSSSGTLPSNTISNLRSDLKLITTRSGVSYNGPQILPPTSFLPKVVEDEPEATKDTVNPTNNESTEDVQPHVVQSESPILISEHVTSLISKPVIAPVSAPKPNPKSSIPYPSRRNNERNRKKANNKIEKFYQIFKDKSFEISFADALILMPKFASTLKALIENKEKLSEIARTPLNKHCSAILLKKLPEKLGDPGKFLIPCDFPGMAECLALADLSASINLMPFSTWKRHSLPDLTPTCMTLELSDRSMSHPVGVAEDVYVKVGSFHFPADFVVVDFDADPRVPLILGRSFLKTKKALIDVFKANYNEMTAKRIDVIDMACEEYSHEVFSFSDVTSSGNPTLYYDPIVSTTSSTLTPFENNDFLLEEVDAFLAIKDDPTSPEVDQSYLRLNSKIYLPTLNMHSRKKLSDIKGIDPEFCTHKILMEEDFEPAVQHQRRVNLKIHNVIKQEVIKLLDAGLIYPISDSLWVSPVHCVPKKGGFTVEENEDNELIPTRLVTGWRICIDYRKLNEATSKDHFPLPFMDQMLDRLAGNQYYCFLDGFSGYFQILIDLKDQEKTTFTCPYRMFAYHRMRFGLCNALGMFQRCMMAIFHDMIEKTMEVFIDDFSVFRNSFQSCLSHLERMLKRCEETNLCLNWEKSHFMVKEGIVLGHKISKQGIEVDKAKVAVITKLPHPTTVKGIRSFLGHAGFNRSDFAIGAVLGQRQDKPFRPIHYASKTMTEAESNYTTTEKEMLAMVACRPSRKANSLRMLNTISGTTPFCLKFVLIKSSQGVYQARKPLKSLRLATIDPQGDTMFAKVMQKFSVTHRLATPYHPQKSGQVKVSNRGLKCILKRAIGENHVSWSDKLDDALWAFRIAYKTLIGCTPYKLVYEKACHLPIELEHKAYWALKHSNFDLKTAGKLKSRWSGPFTIFQVYPYGTVKLSQPDGPNFKVSGHRLKHYFREDVPKVVVPDLQTFPRDH
nr:reverse transcriptase domain-containing protein [Tanacetum cinerariifolium]